MTFLKALLHVTVFIILSIMTQIGGLIYLISIVFFSSTIHKGLKRLTLFSSLYLLSTYVIVPNISPIFGRLKIEDNSRLKAHSFFYKLCNRNYVTPELNSVLIRISNDLRTIDENVKLIYLDASFPFFDGFPLLPHLSHDDGEKVDITFIYVNENGSISNKKKSVSGYGVYEEPITGEFDQTEICKPINPFYDFPKYLTFGKINSDLSLSEEATFLLIQKIISKSKVKKVFIEPHLKARLQLNTPKVRFHGCRAVRHDDHIHVQL